MAYEVRSEKGLPIKKKGSPVLAMDTLEVKIEQLDEKNKSFVAVASTEHEDRDKDIVRQDGWKLANFRKNPIVPWAHNYYGVPIAKSIKTWIDKGKIPRLLFTPKFDPNDDDSMKIFDKYKNGFLTSFSVGFRGIDFTFRDEDDPWWGGREFTSQELLEISSVAVPANPHANTRLNYAGDVHPENLIQMGYPEIFAQTKTGLFYPVMDIAVFTQPKEFEIDKGVVGINAVSLDDEIKVSDPVAYLFDPEMFDDDTANKWIKENVKTETEVKYFDLQTTKKGELSLECLTEEGQIKHFEKSVDFSNIESTVEDSDEKDNVEDTIQDNKDEDGNNIKEDDNEGKSIEDEKVVEEDNSVTIPMKRIIEVTTVMKDSNNIAIDQHVELIASSKEFETISDYFEWKSNELVSFFSKEINELKERIEELSDTHEKTVANLKEISDNGQDLKNSDDKLHDKSSDDNLIELDKSLIKPPGDDNDKTDSEEIIEIDETMLKESNSDVKDTVNSELVSKLKESLQEVLLSISGKID